MRKSRTTRLALAALLAAALPFAAQADGISYTYVEAAYTDADLDGESADGFGLRGSLAFGEHFYGGVEYYSTSVDTPFGDVDFEPVHATLGFRRSLSPTADFIAEASYVRMDVSFGGQSGANDGWRAAAGLRSRLGERVGLDTRVIMTGIEEFEDVLGAQFDLTVDINDTWAIVGRYTTHAYDLGVGGADAPVDITSLGVRANF
jgi:hypothetical protein